MLPAMFCLGFASGIVVLLLCAIAFMCLTHNDDVGYRR